MTLIILYMLFLSVIGVTAVFTGFIVEQWLGGHVSMIYFLAINALSIWLSWVLAIKLTEPKILGVR